MRKMSTPVREAVPRVFGQEAQRDVQQVAGADARREQGLVGVAHRRLGDGDGLLLAQSAGERLGPFGDQPVARAGRDGAADVERGQLLARRDGEC